MTQYLLVMVLNRPAKGSDLVEAAAAASQESNDLAGQWSFIPNNGQCVSREDFKPGEYYREAALLVTVNDASRVNQLAMAIEARLTNVEATHTDVPRVLRCDWCGKPATYDVVTHKVHCEEDGDRAAVFGINIQRC